MRGEEGRVGRDQIMRVHDKEFGFYSKCSLIFKNNFSVLEQFYLFIFIVVKLYGYLIPKSPYII